MFGIIIVILFGIVAISFAFFIFIMEKKGYDEME